MQAAELAKIEYPWPDRFFYFRFYARLATTGDVSEWSNVPLC